MLSLIIPTYNEEENIRKLIPEIFKVFSRHKIKGEVIVVDDDSPDGTGRMAESFKSVKVIHRKKRGLSSAVVEGFKHASGDFIGVMDADFSHPVEKIPEMVKPLMEGVELVIGSRHVPGGGIENWSLKRRFISRGASLLARPLTPIKDPVSGFFFLKKSVLGGVELNPLGYKIGLEIAVKGRYRSCLEVPYMFADRKRGKSKMGTREMFNYLRHILGLYWYKIKIS
jgi:dolichol-phosphate mannosyltransferase